MHQIVYVSAATEPMNASALEHLLKQCHRNNEAYDLTGLLIYKDERFMQALEGPKDNVKHMYATIREDERHTGVIQMAGHTIEERDFPGWPMGFRVENDPDPADMKGFTPLMDEDYLAEHFTDDLSFSHQMLLDFLNAERRKNLREREEEVEEREEALKEREAVLRKREAETTG